MKLRTWIAITVLVGLAALASGSAASAQARRRPVPTGPLGKPLWQMDGGRLDFQLSPQVLSGNFKIDTTCELKALELACKTYAPVYHTVFSLDKLTKDYDPHKGWNPDWGYELYGMQQGASDLGLRSRYLKQLTQRDIDSELDSIAFHEGVELFFIRTTRLLAPAKSGKPYDPWLAGQWCGPAVNGITKPGYSGSWHAIGTKSLVRVIGHTFNTYFLRDVADGKDFTVDGASLKGLTTAVQYQTEGLLIGPPLKPVQVAPAPATGTEPPTDGTPPAAPPAGGATPGGKGE